MMKLPQCLAEEFGADHVEKIPRDVRISTYDAMRRITTQPHKFPNADWDALDRKEAAILSVIDVWIN